MGYDSERFVNLSPDIADHFKCCVCLDIFEEPLQMPCGHIHCKECIRSYFGIIKFCPECRRPCQTEQMKRPHRIIVALLQGLKIKCEYSSEGCPVEVKVEQLKSHTRQCRFNSSNNHPTTHEPTEGNLTHTQHVNFGIMNRSESTHNQSSSYIAKQYSFCIALNVIACIAVCIVVLPAFRFYSTIGYTAPTPDSSAQICNRLTFEYVFWLISALLVIIGVGVSVGMIYTICSTRLETTYRSISDCKIAFLPFAFIYSVVILELIKVYYENVATTDANLTFRLFMFSVGFIVCLYLIVCSDNNMIHFGWILEFITMFCCICAALDLHMNFPWRFTTMSALLNGVHCDQIILTYFSVISCTIVLIAGKIILAIAIIFGICVLLDNHWPR